MNKVSMIWLFKIFLHKPKKNISKKPIKKKPLNSFNMLNRIKQHL